MAFDLVVGKSAFIKDNPVIVGSLDFDVIPIVNRLHKKTSLPFFGQLANYYVDFSISPLQLIKVKEDLYKILIEMELSEDELQLMYKVITIVCFSIDKELALHGIAD